MGRREKQTPVANPETGTSLVCHILPDWLLVYRIEDDVLVLTLARTGTHSDLFGK